MEQRSNISTRGYESMKDFENNDCLTCNHAKEHGYKHLICIHPDLPEKYQYREIMIDKRGQPDFCPLAKNIMKEVLKSWMEK